MSSSEVPPWAQKLTEAVQTLGATSAQLHTEGAPKFNHNHLACLTFITN